MLRVTIAIVIALICGSWRYGEVPPDVTCNFVTGVATGTGAGTCVSPLPTCDGSTNTQTSFNAFTTWAVSTWQASHTGVIGLYIPPGTNCSLTTTDVTFAGIKNLRIIAFGATLSGTYFHLGTYGQYQDNLHSTRLLTATKGATSVTVNPSSSSQPAACNSNATCTALFTVGGWALIAGFDLQSGIGFPSNPAYFQYVKITAINSSSGVISFDRSLSDTYLSTWPSYNVGDANTPDDGGPATLYAFHPEWVAQIDWRGMTFTSNTQLDSFGLNVTFRNITCTATGIKCIYPSNNYSWQMINSTMANATMEVDKMIENATISGSTISQIAHQSRNKNFSLINSTITNLVGTAANTTISGSTISSQLLAGVSNYGRADVLTVSNSAIASVGDTAFHVGEGVKFNGAFNEGINNISGASMSSGVLSIPNSYIAGNEGSIGWAQPGTNVCWSDSAYTCAGPTFQIQNVTQDATNTYVTMNAPGGTFPAWSVTGPLGIQNVPVPVVNFSNATGDPNAVTLSGAAAQGLPMYAYNKRTYVNADTGGAQPYFPIWGNLKKLNINVTAAYTGALTGHLMTPKPLQANWFTSAAAVVSYTPAIVNLAVAGQRSLDATGGYPAAWTGSAGFPFSGDTLTTLSASRFAPESFRSVSDDISSDPSHPMSVTVEVITDMGLVIP